MLLFLVYFYPHPSPAFSLDPDVASIHHGAGDGPLLGKCIPPPEFFLYYVDGCPIELSMTGNWQLISGPM